MSNIAKVEMMKKNRGNPKHLFSCKTGLPDLSCYNLPKRGKKTNDQMAVKYANWP
jgi:hypothetical protein